jgi:hypothetical protein
MALKVSPHPAYQPVSDPLLGNKPDKNGVVKNSAPWLQAVNWLNTWAQIDQEHAQYVEAFLSVPDIICIQAANLEHVYKDATPEQIAACAAGTTPLRFATAVLAPATDEDYRAKLIGWAYPAAGSSSYGACAWDAPDQIFDYILDQAFQHNLNVGANVVQPPPDLSGLKTLFGAFPDGALLLKARKEREAADKEKADAQAASAAQTKAQQDAADAALARTLAKPEPVDKPSDPPTGLDSIENVAERNRLAEELVHQPPKGEPKPVEPEKPGQGPKPAKQDALVETDQEPAAAEQEEPRPRPPVHRSHPEPEARKSRSTRSEVAAPSRAERDSQRSMRRVERAPVKVKSVKPATKAAKAGLTVGKSKGKQGKPNRAKQGKHARRR